MRGLCMATAVAEAEAADKTTTETEAAEARKALTESSHLRPPYSRGRLIVMETQNEISTHRTVRRGGKFHITYQVNSKLSIVRVLPGGLFPSSPAGRSVLGFGKGLLRHGRANQNWIGSATPP